MKNFTLALVAAVSMSVPAVAASYSCSGDYQKSIAFDLNVGKKRVALKVYGETCKGVLDTTYRPTAKYAGYSRYKVAAGQFDACKGLVEKMLGEGNTFDSIKVSGALLDGEDSGAATFIYDFGDYHGQLANERVTCTAN